MSMDPSAALEDFLAAVREHFAASAHRHSESDTRVEAAYMALADAFELYEDALYTAYGEVTPFELFDDVEDEREDSADPDDSGDPDDSDDGDFEDEDFDEDDYVDDGEETGDEGEDEED